MSAQELADLKVFLRRFGVVVAVGSAVVAAALWAARVQAQTEKIPGLEAAISRAERTQEDLVLLQCAQPGLSALEKRICEKYEPRMPR